MQMKQSLQFFNGTDISNAQDMIIITNITLIQMYNMTRIKMKRLRKFKFHYHRI